MRREEILGQPGRVNTGGRGRSDSSAETTLRLLHTLHVLRAASLGLQLKKLQAHLPGKSGPRSASVLSHNLPKGPSRAPYTAEHGSEPFVHRRLPPSKDTTHPTQEDPKAYYTPLCPLCQLWHNGWGSPLVLAPQYDHSFAPTSTLGGNRKLFGSPRPLPDLCSSESAVCLVWLW